MPRSITAKKLIFGIIPLSDFRVQGSVFKTPVLNKKINKTKINLRVYQKKVVFNVINISIDGSHTYLMGNYHHASSDT